MNWSIKSRLPKMPSLLLRFSRNSSLLVAWRMIRAGVIWDTKLSGRILEGIYPEKWTPQLENKRQQNQSNLKSKSVLPIFSLQVMDPIPHKTQNLHPKRQMEISTKLLGILEQGKTWNPRVIINFSSEKWIICRMKMPDLFPKWKTRIHKLLKIWKILL